MINLKKFKRFGLVPNDIESALLLLSFDKKMGTELFQDIRQMIDNTLSLFKEHETKQGKIQSGARIDNSHYHISFIFFIGEKELNLYNFSIKKVTIDEYLDKMNEFKQEQASYIENPNKLTKYAFGLNLF